ncbi:large subunit ribosomal protein L30 [Alkalithermobacter thermoalcaliphilus JW-YL-7 = DSM 7308]|uniref:Large ribosomal subunit protein uL30 n=1 Tax=Alkalithermobacter thermoalcaliphilus JW-YL-7 = DSM 7308 TaxID=1121328 RepID=A0A150FMZ3_CLOPD|nr:ribosomal protein L30 [[Clostridium] paradoxum JW-YL-7 = DSM 7308]SHL23650.1 large subunit ribosomal protein L30 [[Clostridium] paradoxum JW-YL-7 = DSM 7308]
MATLKIKLKRSVIGTNPKQRKTIQALGLRKREQVVEKPDNPQIRGMIEKVSHLVEVIEG